MNKDKFAYIFDSKSKEAWIEKIEKDLKGKDINNLYWDFNDKIRIDPFAHIDDLEYLPNPQVDHTEKNNWKIAVTIECENAINTNRALLNCLENGVEHVVIYISNDWNFKDMLSDVYLSMISIDLVFDKLDGIDNCLNNLDEFLNIGNNNVEPLNIGFIWNGTHSIYSSFKETTDKWNYRARNIHFKSNDDNVIDDLVSLLQQVYLLIKEHGSSQDKIDQLLDKCNFHIGVGNEILFEIAKIRAFKLLWRNLLENIGLEYKAPLLQSYVDRTCLTNDNNDNLVLLSVQAVIGGIAGIDIINISNVSEQKEEQFYGRIAMNIQHIMKFESKMDLVQDPVAGSYHFEVLTNQIVKLAWAKFLEK